MLGKQKRLLNELCDRIDGRIKQDVKEMSASHLSKHIALGVAKALTQDPQSLNFTTLVSNELYSEGRKATFMFSNGSFRKSEKISGFQILR